VKQVTTFLLIRHGAHVLGSRVVAGRSDAAVLSELGQHQVQTLASRLAAVPVTALYSSPVLRTRQTAGPLAKAWDRPIEVLDDLAELDYGDWTGQTLDQVKADERWKHWNAFRSGSQIPGGERMLDIQARVVRAMLDLRRRHGDGATVALVSHGDVIKSAVAYFLGVPLDLFLRIEISLASVCVIAVGDYGPWVLTVNHGGVDLPLPT
jgi:probable phosphoglycerate mutase